jgi:hypothetical protein
MNDATERGYTALALSLSRCGNRKCEQNCDASCQKSNEATHRQTGKLVNTFQEEWRVNQQDQELYQEDQLTWLKID